MNSVFEVVDATSEETYWPLGIFLTLESALVAVSVNDPGDIRGDADDFDDSRVIEIRERKIGLGGIGKTVQKILFRKAYSEKFDSFFWTRRIEP